MQLPPDAIEFETLGEAHEQEQGTATLRAGSVIPVNAGTPHPHEIPESGVPAANYWMQTTYDVVLSMTRVYDRVKDRDVDARTSVSTSRSRPWSVLSGISMARISAVAVVSLPLYEPELKSFRELVSAVNHNGSGWGSDDYFAGSIPFVPSHRLRRLPYGTSPQNLYPHLTQDFLVQYGLYHGLHGDRGGTPTSQSLKKRLNRELNDFRRNPPGICLARPIGDDLVCYLAQVQSQVQCVIKLTDISVTGRELSWDR